MRVHKERSDLWWGTCLQAADSTVHFLAYWFALDIHLATTVLTGYSYKFHMISLLVFLLTGLEHHITSLTEQWHWFGTPVISWWVRHLAIDIVDTSQYMYLNFSILKNILILIMMRKSCEYMYHTILESLQRCEALHMQQTLLTHVEKSLPAWSCTGIED